MLEEVFADEALVKYKAMQMFYSKKERELVASESRFKWTLHSEVHLNVQPKNPRFIGWNK